MMDQAVVFRVGDDDLVCIVHPGVLQAEVGVLLVVGGSQYRVGSHRQCLLLAPALAAG